MKQSTLDFRSGIPAVLFVVVIAGCSNTNRTMSTAPIGPSAQAIPASLNISDTPPAGVSILRFQIQVTSASLEPSNSSQTAVSMLSAPVTVELEHLQSESALLSNFNVPTGEYTSLTASFANPQMTILNRSNATLTVGSQTCAANQVCTLTPTLNQSTVTDSAAPFPITVSSASAVAFLMHFDVNASVDEDLSVSPTISLKELPPLPSGALEQFHVEGRITGVDSTTSSFTLQTGFGHLSLAITANSSTQYEFGSACTADNFTCLVKGEVVRVGLSGMPGGMLVASRVELIAPQGQPALEGVVIGVNSAQNEVQLVLMDFQDDAQGHLAGGGMVCGLPLTVGFSSSTTFSIDADGITLPSGLSFGGINDMIVGQAFALQPVISSLDVTGTPPTIQITFTASNVRLESSEVTATVEAVNSSSTFTLNGLPPLFTNATPAITQIDVETVAGTDFENLTGVGALSSGDTVSAGGLLFNTASGPLLVAERVLER
ncbi:MAG TPA: DUF5666 domain-containing protein [Candidatus Cybelea sp.]|nr:DUF5666 domain-containing protein [Candidatus Cybelea sp.]